MSRKFLEVASMVVTLWTVPLLHRAFVVYFTRFRDDLCQCFVIHKEEHVLHDTECLLLRHVT